MNNKNNKQLFKLTLARLLLPLGAMLSSVAYSEGLLEAYQIAAKRDPKLQQAFANFKSVEKNVPISVANLLPEVTLNAGISYDKVLDFADNPSVRSKYISLDFTQPLFHWDKISRYLQTKLEVEKAIHDLEVAKEDLLMRVSTAYFNILEAMDYLEYIRTEKVAVKELLDQTTEKFNVGFIAITDVEEAKAKYNIQESEEIAAQNAVANRFEELTAILGKKLVNLHALTPKYVPSTPKPNDIAQWVKMALARNHSLRSETLATAIMAKNEDIAFAGHLPNFDFNARYRAVDSSRRVLIDQIITADGFISSYGASIEGNLELYGGGGTQAEVEKAEFNTRASYYNTERIRREAVSDTRQFYRNVLTAIQQVKALEQAVKSSMSALDSTQASYEVGTRASIDVLDRLTELYDEKEKLAAARYAYIKNVLELKRVTGTLTNNDINTVDRWLISRDSKIFKQDKTAVRENVLDVIRNVTNKDKTTPTKSKSGSSKSNSTPTLTPEEIENKIDKEPTGDTSEKNSTVNALEEKLKQLESEDPKLMAPESKNVPKAATPSTTTTTTTTTTKDAPQTIQKSMDYDEVKHSGSASDQSSVINTEATTTTTTTTESTKAQPALTEPSDSYEPLEGSVDNPNISEEQPSTDHELEAAEPAQIKINEDPAAAPSDESLKAMEAELQRIIKQGDRHE